MAKLSDAWIGNLELCIRGANALQANGIHTIGQLDDMTDADLFCLPNVGKLTIAQIRAAVNDLRARYHACAYGHWQIGELSPVPEYLRAR